MVEKMAKNKVDNYGRVLIPKKVREKAGLKEGEDVEIRVKGSEVVIRPRNEDVERKVEELADYLDRSLPKAFTTEPPKRESKWISRKHGLRKLGA
ncbi:hypothetical protein AKJ63_00455 [candidate division MSBL1 archaeon SCGC-AAA259D18]|uniref:SpoVT-AbrB domain-containing protein n=1 Tax=candidate division MSBL1 archaeon SCGC-AAA259D18 TaxID=1698262 RepID=A0A133UCI6_9EURY|nr:hypothetical protein AKJ63_00455 [candidate division MSBL1 archaeon SCGC-AAA259D18]